MTAFRGPGCRPQSAKTDYPNTPLHAKREGILATSFTGSAAQHVLIFEVFPSMQKSADFASKLTGC